MDSSNVKGRFSTANNIDVNWIVRLEEICVSRGLPIPTYETVIDTSQGIYAEFCRIHEYCEVGVTKTSAARKICWRLEAIPQDGNTIIDSSQCDLNGDSTKLQLQDAQDNSNTSNIIAESGVSGEAKATECSDSNTSSSIPEPAVSGKVKAIGCSDTVKYVGNSIGTLQEKCMPQRWPLPTYNIVTDVGPEHARVITIACSIMHYRVLGEGSNLKRVKQEAASKMLIHLQNNPLDSSHISDSPLCASNEKLGSMKIPKFSGCGNCNSPISTADSATPGKTNLVDSAAGNVNIGGNPIGCLQEICQIRAIPLPVYKIEADVVSDYTELGVGSNIKRAKHLAAHKMLIRLHQNNN